MTDKIGVIGAGSWGTTVAKMVGENGNEVLLWGRNAELCDAINRTHCNEKYLPGFTLPANVVAKSDIAQVCKECTLLFMVVPSHGFRAVAEEMGPFLSGAHCIVHGTKGIEPDTSQRMSEILREETPVRRVGMIAGPNLSVELAKRQPAATVVASRYDETFSRAKQALQSSYYRVYKRSDLAGVEFGSAFKNVVALAAGIVDGLELGDNTKALLMTRGLNEMVRLGVATGARTETFSGVAVIGDLVATCVSHFSRNRQVGVRLAKGEPLSEIIGQMPMVAEGVNGARAFHDLAARYALNSPIVEAMYRLIEGDVTASEAIDGLMQSHHELTDAFE